MNFTCAGLRFLVPTLGEHNIYNALAAAAACRALGVSWDAIRERLRTFSLPKMRMERLRIGAVTLINDAYNANPESMLAALRLLDSLPALGRKIVVMGDMKELGQDEGELHRALTGLPSVDHIDKVHCIGPLMRVFYDDLPAHRRGDWTETSAEMAVGMGMRLRSGDIVLAKGSLSMKLALVVDAIRKMGHGAALSD